MGFISRLFKSWLPIWKQIAFKFLARILFHQPQHFLDGLFQSDQDRPADDAVADVQFHQMRHAMQRRQIFVIQSVPGVHLQAERVRLFRAGNEALQFTFESRESSVEGRFLRRLALDARALDPRPM